MNYSYDSKIITEIGKLRKINEDSVLLRQKHTNKGIALLSIVADGMGGLNNGDIASGLLIDEFSRWFDSKLDLLIKDSDYLDKIEDSIHLIIDKINNEIFKQDKKMGTTMSLLFIIGNQYMTKHVGDSRIYFARSIGVEKLTLDHSLYEQALKEGTLNIYNYSEKKMKSILTNAIGTKEKYFFDTSKGFIDNVKVIFMCTDGIYKYINDEEIRQILDANSSITQKCCIVDEKLRKSTASDNYSCIFIKIKKGWFNFARIFKSN